MLRGPFVEEFGYMSKDLHMFAVEFSRMLERALHRALELHTPLPLEPKKRQARRKTPRVDSEQK
jgi:hypothetical protein